MKPRYAQAIRKGILDGRMKAQTAIAADPTYALFSARSQVQPLDGLPLKLRLTLNAYQRTYTRTVHAEAMKPALTQLIDEIYKTLHREDA